MNTVSQIPADQDAPSAAGLLLDIGGVVLRTGVHLVNELAEREPRLAPWVAQVGGQIASPGDELWQQMLRREVTERAYWAQRAREVGEALGQTWDTRRMINHLYAGPQSAWLNEVVLDLMRDTLAAGLRLGALTNDLKDFHGEQWMSSQRWLDLFDVIVDASVTGVMKPDPRAFAAGAQALGLDPGQVVYLDDMPWNVVGGLQAGLIAVEVAYDDPGRAVGVARAHLDLAARAA